MDFAHSFFYVSQMYFCYAACYLYTKAHQIQYQLRNGRERKFDTSSLVLSTSLGSLALPLLVIMSIS